MRESHNNSVCGCFPTGRHYPGIADRLANNVIEIAGLSKEVSATDHWSEAKLAVIDFETTGLNPDTDRIIETGIARFDQEKLIGLDNWLINPGIPIPEESRKVHQISDQELVDAPPFHDILPEIWKCVQGYLPVAYNAGFDRDFLHAEVGRLQPDQLPTSKTPPAFLPEVIWIDPLVWIREIRPDQKSKKLTETCSKLGITIEQAHRATDDAEAAGKVLLAIKERLPITYGELIRIQSQYTARQEIDLSNRRNR